MARYFTLASTRGQGIAKMMEKAKAEPGHPITLYAAAGTGPTFYLVGDMVNDAIQAGMLPVFTFIAHPRPEPVVSTHIGESMRCWADLEEEADESD
jgi:hypothetical protein